MGGYLSYEFPRSATDGIMGMMGSRRRKEFSATPPSCGAAANMPPPATEPSWLINKRRKPTTTVPGRAVVLPDDIILEVLPRLPVKSILRFRAVCRSWAALFSSKDFCSLHMATSKAQPREPKLLLLSLQSRLGSTQVYSCSLMPGPGDDLLFTLDRAPDNSLEAVTPSTCCGLSLFFDYKMRAYYVCNAATRRITRLPPYYRHRGECHSAGLGFDAHTMEYKVVRLVMYVWSSVKCDVYTPGADRWRPAAGEVPFNLVWFASSAINHTSLNGIVPVFANGFLHWLINPNLLGEMPRAAIVLFSVSEETFGFVPSPPFQEQGRPWSEAKGEHLAVMDGQVCIVRHLCDRIPIVSDALEIWGLLGYDSGDWSMNHRIDLSGHIGRALSVPQRVRVIGLVGNGRSGKKIVFATREHYIRCRFQEKVYTYDPRCQVLQDIRSVTENALLNPGPRFSLFEEILALVHKTEENACPAIYTPVAKETRETTTPN